ncbi:MAG: hypothetical protein JO211_05685, partial [Acidobacteriaceae bacterium]|nr:hypothetical protein [Acidobacteriaceae bacterium]
AYVPTLKAHLRVDKLLVGRIQFSSLRLVEPALNLVKGNDGTWNIINLMERLGAPRRAPLNFFPAFEVSRGRIDFKLGSRKTTLYVSDSDVAVYPERSGKLYIRFSGSPARTDRAGNGFGHLRGTASWYVNPASAGANRLDAEVTLDPSNLSELATLVQGHDLGVHGTISSRARIEGPATALRISGELRLEDVHRWDLLPSAGEDWRIRYSGDVDLAAHRLNLETVPWRAGESTPITLQMRVADFARQSDWSVLAQLNNAPLQDLLPLGRRMGLSLPPNLALTGTLAGTIGYLSASGLAGKVSIQEATATLPQVPALHAATVKATISGDRIHLEPADIDTPRGTLQAGGDYYLSSPQVTASLSAESFPVNAFKNTIDAWFGAPSALVLLDGGDLTGSFFYTHQETNAPSWAGEFRFSGATLNPPGLSVPLENSEGHVTFDDTIFELSRFSTKLGNRTLRAAYRYNAVAKRPEHIHLELAAADLNEIEAALEPTLEAQGWLARLRLSRRAVPAWLGARNLDGDLTVSNFSVNQTGLGPLAARFIWQGTALQFTAVQLNLPEGLMRARGNIDLASYVPRYRFSTKVTGFPWRGGLLNASGDFESSGVGVAGLQHLHATGAFSGEDLTLSADDTFSRVSGAFEFSFADGWPHLRLSNIAASDGDEGWNGGAVSQSDGKLIFDLEHEGRQRRVISSLVPENTAVSGLLNPLAASSRER